MRVSKTARGLKLACALVLMWTSACDDSPSATTDAGRDVELDSPLDSSVDEDVDLGPAVTLTLLVQSHNGEFPLPDWVLQNEPWSFPHTQSVDLALRGNPVVFEPVADVRVALDLPDGTRLGEADTDAEGLVSFEVYEAEWPMDVAAMATAYRVDYAMLTLTEIARPTGVEPLVLNLTPRFEDAPELGRVGGTALNRVPDTTMAVWSTAACSDWYYGESDSWELLTPLGVPFDLIAFDVTFEPHPPLDFDRPVSHWARVRDLMLESDEVIDIDFATDGVEPTVSVGSFGLPARESSPLRANTAMPEVIVLAMDSVWTGVTGIATQVRLEGDVVEYSVEAIETPEYGGNWFAYKVCARTFGGNCVHDYETSFAYGRGLPDGEQPPLLDLPYWLVDRVTTIDVPLRWDTFEEGVRPYVWIKDDGEVLWILELSEGATELRLPAPPSNVDLVELLGHGPSLFIALERQIDSEDGVFWLESWGGKLILNLDG